ncbi:AAA family ATPase, partial [Burkholderia cenocepacia]
MSRYMYTAEQQAVIDSDARILAVDAFAGTGKTSTLEGFALARPRARILYIAFNRSIAQSAKERFPKNVECRTTHSLAFAAVGRQYGDKLGNAAPFDIARRMNVSNRRAKQALDTISTWLCTTDVQIGLDHLPKEDVADGTGSAIVKLARAVWDEMTNLKSPIKMPHDGYLKLWAMSHPKLR